MGKFEGSGGEIGVGVGGCALVCGQIEVGVQGDKVWGDVKSYVTDQVLHLPHRRPVHHSDSPTLDSESGE